MPAFAVPAGPKNIPPHRWRACSAGPYKQKIQAYAKILSLFLNFIVGVSIARPPLPCLLTPKYTPAPLRACSAGPYKQKARLMHGAVFWLANSRGNAVLSAKQASFEVSGEVSIVCIAFAPILVPCICAYMELNPKVNVRLLHFNHLLNSSGEVDYDFILTASRYAPDLGEGERLWVTQPLFAEDAYFIISPRHPLFDRLPENDADFDLAQFSEASFITMRQDASYSDFSGDLCQNAGFVLKSYFQSDDFLVKVMVIREGKAVGFLPRSGLELARSICPDLRAVRCALPGGDRTVQLMRKKKSLLSETALDFWDFALDHFNLPPDGED